jgi:hypothetical protein
MARIVPMAIRTRHPLRKYIHFLFESHSPKNRIVLAFFECLCRSFLICVESFPVRILLENRGVNMYSRKGGLSQSQLLVKFMTGVPDS